MIDLSQSLLAGLLVRAFLSGIIFGVIYDVIRFIKMLFGVRYGEEHTNISSRRRCCEYVISFITDLIFWVLLGLVSIVLIYDVSGGVFRGMVYLGILSGLAGYYFSIGRLTLRVSAKLTTLIKWVIYRILRFISPPLRAIFLWIVRQYHLTIGKKIGKIKEKKRIRRDMQKKDGKKYEITDQCLVDGDGGRKATDVTTRLQYRRDGRINFGGIGVHGGRD